MLTIAAVSAQAITFELDWTGQEGYSAQGSFSYDETQEYNSALTIFGLAALLMKKKRTFSIKK
ncbi:MAG: hypothetical protein RID53_02525 [Coleofasciculus sp. B1-GNL1-01]|uniref:hypothetical protein n=1 Tax=Coleofasciculus sp. B1-GNL1-01 TaxID=3068484 RepID=UPI0032FD5DDF